ncbi:hypothetical protein R3P38DRAFT_503279 [Favolaschia claudopus]|uniref:Uncharacterized protein n=1 Tax=Favolaschia claudopus TaxID=2862362 RepID=A0AAV9ZD95_9AGAR
MRHVKKGTGGTTFAAAPRGFALYFVNSPRRRHTPAVHPALVQDNDSNFVGHTLAACPLLSKQNIHAYTPPLAVTLTHAAYSPLRKAEVPSCAYAACRITLPTFYLDASPHRPFRIRGWTPSYTPSTLYHHGSGLFTRCRVVRLSRGIELRLLLLGLDGGVYPLITIVIRRLRRCCMHRCMADGMTLRGHARGAACGEKARWRGGRCWRVERRGWSGRVGDTRDVREVEVEVVVEEGRRNREPKLLCFRRQSRLPRHHLRLPRIVLSLLNIHGPRLQSPLRTDAARQSSYQADSELILPRIDSISTLSLRPSSSDHPLHRLSH